MTLSLIRRQGHNAILGAMPTKQNPFQIVSPLRECIRYMHGTSRRPENQPEMMLKLQSRASSGGSLPLLPPIRVNK